MKVLSVVISCIIDVYLFHLFFQNYFSKRKFFADSVLKRKELSNRHRYSINHMQPFGEWGC